MTFSLVGLVVTSSAANAAETFAIAMATPLLPVLNTPTAVPVPTTVPVIVIPASAKSDPVALDAVAYPTLAAAVAAQDMPADTDEQLRCLATTIYFESKGEPLAGQLAVAQVVLNRAEQRRFGASVCDVITQRGQFSFVRGGRIPAVDVNRAAYRTAVAIAKVAMEDAWESDAGRALYFHARRVSPSWNRVKVASIGNHVFYR